MFMDPCIIVDCVWNVMAHAQKPDFVFRQNGRVPLIRQGPQFSRLLAGELCAPACRVCTARASLCSAVMRRLLVTHSILLFPLHFSSRASTVCHHISTGLYKPYRNNQQDATVYYNLLFQSVLNAQHVSSDTPLIIRSSRTVIAASGFTYICGCRQLPATTDVCKTRGCNYSFW